MGKNKETSRAVDTLLKGLALGVITSSMLVAPNSAQLLEKPLGKFLDKLDNREKQRAISRMKSYIKTQGLVRGDYDHGLELTPKAMKRIARFDLDELRISVPKKWDSKWRIVMFDIPENNRKGRAQLTFVIKRLGFQILQQSVWIFPYDCRDQIAKVALEYQVEKWVTYIETSYIDNQAQLIKRFKITQLV